MSKTFAALGLAVSLFAIAAPLQAAGEAGKSWPTLEEVKASSPVREVVKVDCDNAMWPTARQIARHAEIASDDSVLLRRHIVASGRAVCASGFTHALIVFKAASGDVAVIPAAERAANGG